MDCLPFNGFFLENIWSPLGANIYSLFVSGVVGATGHLSDAQALDVSLFAFEPERWKEKEYIW
jgi:hypothetical protein